jgi:hypothetical protein
MRLTLRGLSTATIALATAGVLCVVAAMAVYPGGTWMNRATVGHSFWGNFLCDLQQPIALNGSPNPIGSRLAQVGALALFASCAAMWPLTTVVIENPRLAGTARLVGIGASVLAFLVPLLPSERWPALHSIAIAAAGAPGLAALGLATVGIGRSRHVSVGLRVLSLALVGVGVTTGALWSVVELETIAVPPALPAMQRVAGMLLVAWILAIAVRARWSFEGSKASLGE